MDVLGSLSLIVAIIAGIWGIYQTTVTNRLQEKVNRLSVQLDQRILRIHRARELCADIHRTFAREVHLNLSGTESLNNFVNAFVCLAELGGLVDAIGDKRLKTLVDDDLSNTIAEYNPKELTPSKRVDLFNKVIPIFAHIYRRLYELPEEITQGETVNI